MSNLKRDTIIVGVDGTETAARAALIAAELAAAMGAPLHVVSAFDKFESQRVEAAGEEFFTDSAAEAQQVANGATVPLRTHFPQVPTTAYAEEGNAGEALIRHADEHDARLIVVGNRRVQGLSRVLGSIATEVARKANCDVYIAHTH